MIISVKPAHIRKQHAKIELMSCSKCHLIFAFLPQIVNKEAKYEELMLFLKNCLVYY